jgi:uncharacterized membrane protein
MKNMSSSSGGTAKAHPKLGGETYLRTNLGEKTSLIPFFFPMYYFDFLISSPVLTKLGLNTLNLD